MNEKIKNHLIAYNTSKGWDTTESSLMETVIEADSLWEGKRDRHRWYTLIPTVVCIEGMFLQYDYCDVDGETSNIDDCIGGYKLHSVIEVKPVQKTVTIYEAVEC